MSRKLRQTIIYIGFFLYFVGLSQAAPLTPLPAEAVFQLTTKPVNATTFQLNWVIKPGYFLYQDRIHIPTVTPHTLRIGVIHFPDPQFKITHQKKTILIYRDHLTLDIPFEAKTPGEIPIKVHFQGCSDQGFCYPPMTKTLMAAVDDHLKLQQVYIETEPSAQADSVNHSDPHETVSPGATQTHAPTAPEKPIEHMLSEIEQLFSSESTLMIVFTFFGFGLLLAFTPCVLPMIPVLSSMIVGHGHTITTRKALLLSLSYVLSMSMTYSIIGGVIAVLGNNLQVQMQSPLAISGFSLLFVLLALSMFGLYDLRLPVSWQNRLARVTRHQSGGHYLNAALMGSLSILILSPCITPPLLGALSYIAQNGKLSIGLVALFFLGLGMGTPLLIVGASAGKLLPKAGKWMNTVKSLFGVLLLGVAIQLMGRLIAPFYSMLLWSLLLIFISVACKPFANPNTPYEKARQGLGLICLVYGVFILYGASSGHTNPLLPLQPMPVESLREYSMNKMRVNTLVKAKQVLAQAKIRHQPVMIDFTAAWCESCKVMANTTLRDPMISHALQGIMWLEIDLTANNRDTLALLHHFKVIAPPTFQFYAASGKPLTKLQLVGEVPPATLLEHINKAIVN